MVRIGRENGWIVVLGKEDRATLLKSVVKRDSHKSRVPRFYSNDRHLITQCLQKFPQQVDCDREPTGARMCANSSSMAKRHLIG